MKKIGIPGWSIDGKYFGVGLSYAEYFRQFGEVIILMPDTPFRNDLDLLVLPGGADITPHQHANSTLSLYTGSSNPMLEYFDNVMLPDYLNSDTPIIGICRGAQKLWSLHGGEFIQHCIDHEQSSYNKDECHGLFFTENYKHNSKLVEKVTSRHHQTMSVKNGTPEQLTVIAYAKEGTGKTSYLREDIVEVFKVTDKEIYGVQYHPEDMPNDLFTPKLIENLLYA